MPADDENCSLANTIRILYAAAYAWEGDDPRKNLLINQNIADVTRKLLRKRIIFYAKLSLQRFPFIYGIYRRQRSVLGCFGILTS